MSNFDLWASRSSRSVGAMKRIAVSQEKRRIVEAVVNANRHEWWELKREIFDAGESTQAIYVFYYPRVKQILARLPESTLKRIAGETPTAQDKEPLEALRNRCFGTIIGEILRRASIAAQRTQNW